jgi:hypothetical protein
MPCRYLAPPTRAALADSMTIRQKSSTSCTPQASAFTSTERSRTGPSACDSGPPAEQSAFLAVPGAGRLVSQIVEVAQSRDDRQSGIRAPGLRHRPVQRHAHYGWRGIFWLNHASGGVTERSNVAALKAWAGCHGGSSAGARYCPANLRKITAVRTQTCPSSRTSKDVREHPQSSSVCSAVCSGHVRSSPIRGVG